MSATPREVAALMFAREALTPLDGTKLMESLDSVLASLPRERAKPGPPVWWLRVASLEASS